MRHERLAIEKDLPPQGKADSAVYAMNVTQIVMLVFIVILSVLYVLSKFGNGNVSFYLSFFFTNTFKLD